MIKRATVKDSNSIAAIEKLVFDQSFRKEFFDQELTNTPFAYYFIYELDKTVIAYIGFRVVDQIAEMMNFCVDPKHQGKGYGSKLLEHVLVELTNKEVNTVILEVRKSSEKEHNIYLKMGFVKSHIRKNCYKTEDAIVFIKEVGL